MCSTRLPPVPVDVPPDDSRSRPNGVLEPLIVPSVCVAEPLPWMLSPNDALVLATAPSGSVAAPGVRLNPNADAPDVIVPSVCVAGPGERLNPNADEPEVIVPRVCVAGPAL